MKVMITKKQELLRLSAEARHEINHHGKRTWKPEKRLYIDPKIFHLVKYDPSNMDRYFTMTRRDKYWYFRGRLSVIHEILSPFKELTIKNKKRKEANNDVR